MLVVYAASCALFVFFFERLRLVAATRKLLGGMQQALKIVTDRGLSDDEKEAAIQQHAIASLRGALVLTFGLVATLLAAATPPLLSAWFGWIELEAFIDFSLDPLVLVATVVVLGGAVWVYRAMTRAEE